MIYQGTLYVILLGLATSSCRTTEEGKLSSPSFGNGASSFKMSKLDTKSSSRRERDDDPKTVHAKVVSLIEAIQHKTKLFLTANSPQNLEETQIHSVLETASKQDPQMVADYMLSEDSRDIDQASLEITEDLNGLKIQDGGETQVLVSDKEIKKDGKSMLDDHVQMAGVFMVVMGSIGVLAALPTGVMTWMAFADGGSQSGQVNSGFLESLKRHYNRDGSGRYRVMGRAETMGIIGSVVALGLNISMIAVGASIIQEEEPSDQLKIGGGAILMTSGLASIVLGSKLAKNAWMANSTFGKKVSRAGLFGMVPITIGVATLATGVAMTSEYYTAENFDFFLAGARTPLERFLMDVQRDVRAIYQLRQEILL